MIVLRDKETNAEIGTLSEEELQYLIDELEEESSEDQDYWIDANTLDMLREKEAPAGLLAMIEGALDDRDGMEIVWSAE